jgi:hypothetical protein
MEKVGEAAGNTVANGADAVEDAVEDTAAGIAPPMLPKAKIAANDIIKRYEERNQKNKINNSRGFAIAHDIPLIKIIEKFSWDSSTSLIKSSHLILFAMATTGYNVSSITFPLVLECREDIHWQVREAQAFGLAWGL